MTKKGPEGPRSIKMNHKIENSKGDSEMKTQPKSEWVQLTKWDRCYDFPTKGTMRNICARRKENGAEAFLSMLNNRIYINATKFFKWLEERGCDHESN